MYCDGAGNPLLCIAPPSRQQDRIGRGRQTPDAALLIGSGNVRLCSTCETKRSEIGSVTLERKLTVLALSETKVKGKGECKFGSAVRRVSGVVNGRARKDVVSHLSNQVLDGVVKY